jgi:hypothetical protein
MNDPGWTFLLGVAAGASCVGLGVYVAAFDRVALRRLRLGDTEGWRSQRVWRLLLLLPVSDEVEGKVEAMAKAV